MSIHPVSACHRRLLVLALLMVFTAVGASTVQAQVAGRSTGIGAQIGDHSGITLKYYQNRGFAYDFLASWDFDDYLFLNAHGLFERPIPESPLHYYLGPGAFLTFRDRPDDDVEIGISGNFGVNFSVERFEVFLQVTPRLSVIPDTEGEIGGGLGMRYYF